jgi:hypothetical protein
MLFSPSTLQTGAIRQYVAFFEKNYLTLQATSRALFLNSMMSIEPEKL